MKKILFAIVLLISLMTVAAAHAVSVDQVTFGSANNPITRSNPEADEVEDEVQTASTTFDITNNLGEDVTITGITFSSSEYGASSFQMNFSETNFVLTNGNSNTITTDTIVPRNIDAMADIDNGGNLDFDSLDGEVVGTLTVTYDNSTDTGITSTSSVVMYAEMMMDVELTVVINGEDYSIDDDEIEELRPDDDVSLCVIVKNEFDDNDDNVDMDVSVDIDDDADFEADDTSDDDTVDANDEVEFCFDFDIDDDVEDGDDFTISVDVVGDDDNGATYTTSKSFDVEFELPQGEVDFTETSLMPDTVCLGSDATASFSLENEGREDQDNVRVQVTNSRLGIDRIFSGINLEDADERDNDYDDSFTFRVNENEDAGTYNIRFQVFYEDEDGDDTSRFIDERLTVEDCSAPSGSSGSDNGGSSNNGGDMTDNDSDDRDDGGIVVTNPSGSGSTSGGQTTGTATTAQPVRARSSDSGFASITMLVILIVVLALIVGYLVFVLARNR